MLLGSFVVPNKPIERRKVLLDFSTPLEAIEKSLGLKLHHSLEREKLGDLCDEENGGCRMMDYRKFQGYYVKRGLKGARNERDLERYLNRAKELDLIDPEVVQICDNKRKEFSNHENVAKAA